MKIYDPSSFKSEFKSFKSTSHVRFNPECFDSKDTYEYFDRIVHSKRCSINTSSINESETSGDSIYRIIVCFNEGDVEHIVIVVQGTFIIELNEYVISKVLSIETYAIDEPYQDHVNYEVAYNTTLHNFKTNNEDFVASWWFKNDKTGRFIFGKKCELQSEYKKYYENLFKKSNDITTTYSEYITGTQKEIEVHATFRFPNESVTSVSFTFYGYYTLAQDNPYTENKSYHFNIVKISDEVIVTTQ